MKKKSRTFTKCITSFALAATMVFTALPLPAMASSTEFLWLGSKGVAKVETGMGNGTEGQWWSANDHADGGKSELIWESSHPTEAGDPISDEDVKKVGGIGGTIKLDKGELDYDPFVMVGFNVVGVDSSEKAVVADVSGWGGLSIA